MGSLGQFSSGYKSVNQTVNKAWDSLRSSVSKLLVTTPELISLRSGVITLTSCISSSRSLIHFSLRSIFVDSEITFTGW